MGLHVTVGNLFVIFVVVVVAAAVGGVPCPVSHVSRRTSQTCRYSRCGRTDKGVSALGQVRHSHGLHLHWLHCNPLICILCTITVTELSLRSSLYYVFYVATDR
jgi:hypothetical protein